VAPTFERCEQHEEIGRIPPEWATLWSYRYPARI
jgi:hypothetical protein